MDGIGLEVSRCSCIALETCVSRISGMADCGRRGSDGEIGTGARLRTFAKRLPEAVGLESELSRSRGVISGIGARFEIAVTGEVAHLVVDGIGIERSRSEGLGTGAHRRLGRDGRAMV